MLITLELAPKKKKEKAKEKTTRKHAEKDSHRTSKSSLPTASAGYIRELRSPGLLAEPPRRARFHRKVRDSRPAAKFSRGDFDFPTGRSRDTPEPLGVCIAYIQIRESKAAHKDVRVRAFYVNKRHLFRNIQPRNIAWPRICARSFAVSDAWLFALSPQLPGRVLQLLPWSCLSVHESKYRCACITGALIKRVRLGAVGQFVGRDAVVVRTVGIMLNLRYTVKIVMSLRLAT